jgi:hypothetical protein
VTALSGFLLLRRGGGLWGLANAEVRGIARRDGGFRVATSGGELAADEVLGVADLEVRPAALLGRFWPEAAAGLAVVGREPLVVLDPRHPPRALRAPAAGPRADEDNGWEQGGRHGDDAPDRG